MLASVRRMLLALITILLVLYCGVGCYFWSVQRAILFPAPAPQRPNFHGTEIWELKGTSPSAPVIYAWYLPAPDGAPTVVHFHGNAEQLSTEGWLLLRHQQAGLGFLAVEYPGYGLAAEQTPSEEGLYQAATVALDELQGKRGVSVEQTVLSGRSLGTGVAVEMARRGRGARLELVSPFPSIPDVASELLTFLPTHLLVRDRFDSESKAADVHMPVFVVYGTADEVVPARLTEKLLPRFAHVETYVVPGGHHNDLLDQDPKALNRLLAFARGSN